MRKPKSNSKLRSYLFDIGAIDAGEDAIRDGKKLYWRAYDLKKKQEKRKAKRSFTVSFEVDEVNRLKYQSKKFDLSVPEYIKHAVRSTLADTIVYPNPLQIKYILQLLNHYKNQVQAIAEKDTKNWMGVSKNYEALSDIIRTIERNITESVSQCPKVSSLIEEELKKNPSYINELKSLIMSRYDTKESEQKTGII